MVEGKEIKVQSGAVTAEAPEAARIGARVLEKGGNAMDAAAAACLATAVLVPYFADIGGYVCAGTILHAPSASVWSLDSNSVAPAASHDSMFSVTKLAKGRLGINESEYNCSVKEDANIYGALAVGVPGFMGGVGVLWEKWGRLKWPEIVDPSIALLQNGFPYDKVADHIEKRFPIIRQFEPTSKLLIPDGKFPKPDDIWHRPDLENVLQRIASAGWRDFYEGEIGKRVADYVSNIGGILTRADMANFQPRVTEPMKTTYREASVYGSILPNGALSTLEVLNMLEGFEPLPLDDPQYWHQLAEILKLAWRDRFKYIADPDFEEVPTDKLLNKNYALGRVENLRNFPDRADRTNLPQASANSHGTSHLSVADAEGNLVAVTVSQGNPFGSCVTVPGTGFTLAHGMCRFDPRPGFPNSVQGGKRPLNNVCPLILRMPGRDIALGMHGGRRIVSVVPQIAHRLVDYGMTAYPAAAAPRIHTLAYEPLECEANPPFPYQNELLRMGHELRKVEDLGGTAHCAEFLHATRTIRAGGTVGAAGIE